MTGVAREHADLANLVHRDAGNEFSVLAQSHHDQALVVVLATVRSGLAGVGEQAHPVGLQAVGDPHFFAVDDVVVTILLGEGAQRRHIAARARFAHSDAAHHVARNGRCEELAAQLIAAVFGERRGAHVGLHANRHGDAAARDFAQRFRHGDCVGVVKPRAAKLLGFGEAQQSQVAKTLEHLMRRKDPRLFPLIDKRVDLVMDVALQTALYFLMLVSPLHELSP